VDKGNLSEDTAVIIKERALQFRYATIPAPVLYAKNLSFGAKVLYAAIIDYIWHKNKASCFPSHNTLADKLGITDDTVRKYLMELRAEKFIDWKKAGYQKSNRYYLLEFPNSEEFLSPGEPKIKKVRKKIKKTVPNLANLAPKKVAVKSGSDDKRYLAYQSKRSADYNSIDIWYYMRDRVKEAWPTYRLKRPAIKERKQLKSLVEEFEGVHEVLRVIDFVVLNWEQLQRKYRIKGGFAVNIFYGFRAAFLGDCSTGEVKGGKEKGGAQYDKKDGREKGKEGGWNKKG